MRAAVLHRPGDVRLETVPKPRLQPGHALLRVAVCGVCGSDIPRILTKGAHRLPLICGHEFSGYVVDRAEDVTHVREGDLVTVPPLIPCFRCDQCVRGFPSRCLDYDYFGSRRDGAYAEFVLVPASNLLPLPPGLPEVGAALADPAAIALHALWKTGLTVGQRLAVVGCGPIGLLAIQWARLFGVTEIVAVDVSDQKLELAREAGATAGYVGDAATREAANSCDVVVEGAGHPTAINTAIRLIRAGGHAAFIGIPEEGGVGLDPATFGHFLRQEVTLHGSWNSFSAPFPGAEWRCAVENLAAGRLRWDFLVSHDLPLEELPATFGKLGARQEFFSKILFRP